MCVSGANMTKDAETGSFSSQVRLDTMLLRLLRKEKRGVELVLQDSSRHSQACDLNYAASAS